jgi:hypothetical protein
MQFFKNAYMRLYIRGQQTRSELHTGLGNTTTIYDEKKGNAVMMNEYGGQHVLVRLSTEQYKLINKKYANSTIENLADLKTVYGYTCKSARIKFNKGSEFKVYYTADLKFQTVYNGIPTVLDGFPMEYESEIEGLKVTYKVRNIKLDAVTANLFDIPDGGFREIRFEEIYKP